MLVNKAALSLLNRVKGNSGLWERTIMQIQAEVGFLKCTYLTKASRVLVISFFWKCSQEGIVSTNCLGRRAKDMGSNEPGHQLQIVALPTVGHWGWSWSLWGQHSHYWKAFSNPVTILLEFWVSRATQGGVVQRQAVLTAGTGTDGWHTHQAPVSTCTIRSVGGGMSALQPWKLFSEKQLVHRCVL